MINKLILQSAISKYYLGQNESVKWVINDKTLTVDFITPNQNVLGSIECSNFPMDNCELAIFNTKKLLNLINICSGELLVETEKLNDIYTKLHISDMSFNVSYALAEPRLIDKVPTLNTPEWIAEADLNPEDVSNIIKAKNALNETETLTISTEKNDDNKSQFVLTLGDENGHDNKAKYFVDADVKEFGVKVPYDSGMIRTILQANKGEEKGKMYLSSMGLMCLQFESEEIKSSYYIVRKEDDSF